MDIKAYNTNIPVYSQPVQNTAETDSGSRQAPASGKTAVATSNAGTQQETSSALNRGVLPDAEIKDTDKGVTAVAQKVKDSTAGTSKGKGSALPDTKGKMYFAVDDNNNVVIKVEDSKGNVVSQIPPEEYIKMSKVLEEISTNLFHTTA
ncbi:MAG: flagellar protein FlaG [Nitrospirae bacterium]|nr:flagellar protein FlaG [Nitrospirota bacterium]MBF0534551.1 flagellar protein FlaG [Nitrospirota bacterium]MBF0617586.1 flagellar protein FlaG [Nitrospirota bacterium]